MNIIISNLSNEPIYEQVKSQIKAIIISGELNEGDMLPSIRALAKDLRISVITTKRAYDELEKEGYIYTIAAKGCFVAGKNTEIIKEENLKQIEQHLQSIAKLAKISGLTKNDILNMFQILQEEEE